MPKILCWFALALMVSAPSSAAIHSGGRQYQGEQHYQRWVSSYHRSSSSVRCIQYCQTIRASSQRYGVPEQLIISVIHHESAFNPNAVSPKGAKGLMQLMDINSRAANINPFNPKENIDTGTALLARLIKKYNDIELALAAYNAGEGNVDKYNGVPPFTETQRYVANVLQHYVRDRQ
ncbi:lytic transglycosylase domain-containing protein [Vibrio jasicida]|uniref:lytic transglycosylase domain-containing protein n=1 Tax=Vibrio jasicida TaxID=766224 RepID=UPI0005EEBD5B|nr:lytic transglycosylase domain-containing protein [Vibrio jasicida]